MSTDSRTATHEEDEAPVEAWDAIAHQYSTHVADGEADLATAALRLAGVRAGQTFLDVCAGTGGLSLPAARLGAKVLATDWSPRMIEEFVARASAEGLDAEGRVMECHNLDIEDDSFDVTGSQYGVMLVPDQVSALREMVRVTRPGGRVFLTAYGDPARFEALGFFVSAIQAVVPGFEGPSDDEPMLAFQVADPEVLRNRLIDAGLTNVTVNTSHQEKVEFRIGRQVWDWCLGSNPVPNVLVADLTEDQRADVVAVVDGMVRERVDEQGNATLTAPLNIGVGTKPATATV
jgi:ubiquinone/menaquinone biosynthesis C-methylase UbiE